MAHSNVQRIYIYIYISRRAIVNKITASISIPIQSFNNPTRDLNWAEADSTFEFEISSPPLWPLFSAIISDLSSESRCTQSYASKFECTGNLPSVLAESEHKGQTKLVIESLFTTTKILQLCSSMFRTGRLFDWKTGKRAIQEFNDPQISQSPDRRRERGRGREKGEAPLRRFVNFGVIEPWPSSGTMVKEGAFLPPPILLEKTIVCLDSGKKSKGQVTRAKFLSFFYS